MRTSTEACRKRKALLGVLLTALILVVGCNEESSKPPKPGIIRITPSELFSGEFKDIGPHIASTNGCVKIEYAGPKVFLATKTVIWEDGQSRFDGGGSSRIELPVDGKISFSLHDIRAYNESLSYELIIAAPGSTTTSHLPKVKALEDSASRVMGSYLELQEPVEVPDDEEIAVWGYCWRPGGEWDRNLPIEEQAKRAKWAVVVYISTAKDLADLHSRP